MVEPFFISRRNDLEEEMRLISRKRQIADFIDDQQTHPAEMSEHVSQAPLSLCCFNFEDQISCCDELSFDPSACCLVTDRDGKMRFADTRRPKENSILFARNEGK